MNDMLRAISALLVIGPLVPGHQGMSAQAPVPVSTPVPVESRVDSDCATTPCLVGGDLLRDAPFSAEATMRWRPHPGAGGDELRATARYLRDSKGRVRVEQGFAGRDGPQRIFVIPDPDSGWAYVLDPAQRTSAPVPRGLMQMMIGGGGHDNFVLPVSSRQLYSLFQVPEVDPGADLDGPDSIGQRVIAGVAATGRRFATRSWAQGQPGRGERWVSPELKLVVYSRSEVPEIGVFDYQLTNVSRTEPPEGAFEVPVGYVETSFDLPLTWSFPNARAQGSSPNSRER